MRHARTVEALVGSTPLVDLSDLTSSPVTILGKLEAANPGGSAKDRVARAMVEPETVTGSNSATGVSTPVRPT